MCDYFPEDVLLDYRQGRLPAGESAKLRDHLPGCPACQTALRDLAVLLAQSEGTAPLPGVGAEARVQAAIEQAARDARRRRRRVRLTWLSAAASVALLVGAWLTWHFLGGPRPEPVIATLTVVHADVVLRRDGVNQVARAGMPLRRNDTLAVPADGSAVLAFADTTRAELGPDTTFALANPPGRGDDPDAVYLREGFLAVEAPSDAAPMRVFTPEAQADLRDTKCTLGADERHTSLRVAAGSVQVTRIRDGVSVAVPAGHRSTVADNVDPRPVPSRSGTVLQIVSRDKRFPDWERFNQLIGNRLVGNRLWRLGFRVEVRNYSDLQPADLAGRPLVIASLFDYNVGAEDALRRAGLPESGVPVVCLEPAAYPVLGMTGPNQKVDFGFESKPWLVDFPSPTHPLSAGLKGTGVNLFNDAPRFCAGWGKPADTAVTVAHLTKQPDRAAVFAYERGVMMVDRTAPARRVGLFLDPWRVDEGTPAAWALVDAAVEWCVEPAVP